MRRRRRLRWRGGEGRRKGAQSSGEREGKIERYRRKREETGKEKVWAQ